MTEYLIDKKDVEFTLFDHAGLEDLLGMERYAEYSDELFKIVLNEGYKFAQEQLAPTNQSADHQGVKFDNGKVFLPNEFEKIYKNYREAGWFAPTMNPEYGGQGLPLALGMALLELFCGANASFMFLPGLTVSAGHLIENHGTEKDKQIYVEKMYTGEWTGTMCLTEPQAGSALGDITTTATPVDGEDFYQITGNKIFISEGEHQLTDNIVHLVLARVPGDPAGSKGISLFIVPKYNINDDGSLGDFNDVRCTGIEEKMGIHASPTCSLSFGDDGQCRGWLVGERCRGLAYMFQMMNEARIVTGLQGVALGNAAYQSALAYAKERKQGPKITDRSENAASVAIIEHPDVRRNLMIMKAYGEAIRALLYNTANLSDYAIYSDNDAVKTKCQDMLDLLTPVCKAFATDIGFKMTEIAMQVLGGYGYITEYGIEQRMRDVKIASIYEGTNGIQALDLLGRKMRLKQGGLFLTWLQDTNEILEKLKGHEALGELAEQIDKAKNSLAEAAFGFSTSGKKDPLYPLLHATPFLRMFGLVESAKLLLQQAGLSHDKLTALWQEKGISPDDKAARLNLVDQNDDARYWENKIHTASFFVYQLLPEARALLNSIKSNDRSALEVQF